MNDDAGRRHALVFAAAVGFGLLVVLYLARIGGFPLQDPDEGRYAEIAREMLATGDAVTPRIDGVRYFEKPPLLHWLVAFAMRAFGESEGSARLVPALSGIATVATTFALGCAAFGLRAGLLGAAILASSPLFFIVSQAVVIDPLLAACTTAALAAAWGVHVSARRAPWAIVVAGATALGVLAKGPVALVLPGLVVAAFLALRRDGPALRALLRPAPIAVFAAIAVPWFAIVWLRNPEFGHAFFVREHLERFATDRVGHPEGPLFYLPVLAVGLLPWSALALLLPLDREGRAAARGGDPGATLFLWTWALGMIAFFSAARSKLPTYLLPALPPLALLLGAWLDRLADRDGGGRRVFAALGWLLLALGTLVVIAGGWTAVVSGDLGARFDVEPDLVRRVGLSSLLAGAVLAATGWVLRLGDGAGRAASTAALVLAVGIGGAIAAALGARVLGRTSARFAAAILAEAPDPAGRTVVVHRSLMQGLSFYTRSPVVLLDPADGFGEIGDQARENGDRQRVPVFWSDLGRLAEEWRSGRRVFVLADAKGVGELADVLVPPPRVLARHGKRVLLANDPPGR